MINSPQKRNFNNHNKTKDPEVDYKNLQSLKKHLMENGRLIPSRMTGASAAKQRQITEAVKLARFLALLPYTDKQQQKQMY